METILFIFFAYTLLKSSQYVLKEIQNINKIIGMEEFFLGFIMLALVSNLPDLSIGVYSILKDHGEIGVSDVLGSVVTDILLATGLVFLLTNLKNLGIEVKTLTKMLFATALLPILFLLNIPNFLLSFILFSTFVYFNKSALKFYRTKKRRKYSKLKLDKSFVKSLLILGIATFLTVISSKLVIDYSLQIIRTMNISDVFIGGVAIALSTSLPEISIALHSLNKPKTALGTVTGASLVNLTLVLSVLLLLTPLNIGVELTPLIVFCIFSAGIVYIFIELGFVGRKQGAILLILYLVYVYFIFSGNAPVV